MIGTLITSSSRLRFARHAYHPDTPITSEPQPATLTANDTIAAITPSPRRPTANPRHRRRRRHAGRPRSSIPQREPENCLKLVLPSQTQVVGARVRAATAAGQPIHLPGVLMGGGASTDAMKDHLAAGLPLSATADAARTIHNDLDTRASAWRRDSPGCVRPARSVIETGDVDLGALATALAPFGIDLAGARRRRRPGSRLSPRLRQQRGPLRVPARAAGRRRRPAPHGLHRAAGRHDPHGGGPPLDPRRLPDGHRRRRRPRRPRGPGRGGGGGDATAPSWSTSATCTPSPRW